MSTHPCRRALSLTLAFCATACGGGAADGGGESVAPERGRPPYEKLSDYGFFEGALRDLVPAPGVVPYDVQVELWSDGAHKDRFLALPEGGYAAIEDRDDWRLPVGSMVVKSFRFPVDRRDPTGPYRLVETRVLLLGDDGWSGHTYVWDHDERDAVRLETGRTLTVDVLDETGQPVSQPYQVPNDNQCKSCHERNDEMHLLGVITHQLNHMVTRDGVPQNQLAFLSSRGALRGVPDPGSLEAYPEPFGAGRIEPRARAYLGANCSHCHRPGGAGGDSGLVLLAWETDALKYGTCKPPAAAGAGAGGNDFDIVPGHPEKSVIPFRMGSTDPEVKMPELPTLLADEGGRDLVGAWIAAMPRGTCE